MKSKPLVSIIVPVYNVEEYLPECLASIIGQTYGNFELILINDGSTDRSGDICQAVTESDKRVRTIHKTNSGVSSARNLGLDNSRGIWIMFVDADDILPKHGIESLLQYATESDIDCISGTYDKFFRKNDIHINPQIEPHDAIYMNGIQATRNLLYQKDIINGPVAKLYRASSILKARFPEELSIAEDLYFNYLALKNIQRVAIVSTTAYLYRQRPNSAMRSDFSRRRMDGLISTKKIISDSTAGRDASILRAAKARHFMEAVFISMQIPKGQYLEEQRECESAILECRQSLAADREAKTPHRILAMMSMYSPRAPIMYSRFRSTLNRLTNS